MIFPRPLFFHAIRKSSAAEYVAPLLSTIAGFEWYPFGRGVTCPAGRSVNSSSVPRALSVGLYFRIRSRDVINGCSAKSFEISKPILLLPPPFSRRSRISAEASRIFGNASPQPHCFFPGAAEEAEPEGTDFTILGGGRALVWFYFSPGIRYGRFA